MSAATPAEPITAARPTTPAGPASPTVPVGPAAAAAAAAVPATPAEPVVDDYEDTADSAYNSELASYTTSLASKTTDYRQENGRRYHAYKEGSYLHPNDETEQDRLDIAHKMIEVCMEGKLHNAPVKNPQRILDLGTGTGIWAIEMGDIFPQADILGNDLSPIQPRWVPPNVRFEVDDIEADWTYSQKFDFIHCRCLYGAIRDWPRLVRQIYENTKPGCYAEFVDIDIQWRSPDDTLKGTASELANNEFLKGMYSIGLEPNPGRFLESWVRDQGFEDVHVKRMIVPFGTWPADKRLKEAGAWNHLQTTEGLESFFLAIFTRMLGYSKIEVDTLCARVRKELNDPKFHAYFLLYDVYGRRPESDAPPERDD
jgi:SAM-dependent methyltransferase